MAGSGAVSIVKTVLLPLIAAALLYLILFYGIFPFYQRYRANLQRYSQYAPLTSTLQSTTSIFDPYIPEVLRPRSLRERIGNWLSKVIFPRGIVIRNRFSSNVYGSARRDSAESEESDDGDGGLFDAESGERMVGFDMNEGRRGANNRGNTLGIRGSREDAAMRNANTSVDRHGNADEASDRRLSRELEEGFRDDSEDSENEDEEVTVGRRRPSMNARVR